MILRRISFFIIGLFILSAGISLMIEAEIGAGAWDALNVGLSETIGLTVGSWVLIVGCVVLLLNAFLLKRKPDILAIGTIFVIGLFIDFWLLYLLQGLEPDGLFLKVCIFLAGLVIASIGIAIYLQAKFPLSPLDNLMVAISTRFNVSLGVGKTIGELTGLTLAFLFHGPIGIGTIICTLCIGPIIQLFFPFFEKLMNHNKKTSRA